MHRTAEWVREVSGLQVQYIIGKLRVETSRGTRYAKGAITGDTIYIQADNMRYSVRQIAEHEVFHDIANGNRGLVSAIEEAILNRYSEAEYQKIVERYLEAYAGVYEDDEELLRKIATEIFADA